MKKLLPLFVLCALSTTATFAAGNPWVGWWNPDPARSNYIEVKGTVIIPSPSRGVLRWEYPAVRFAMEGKPDGSDMSLNYPNMPKGVTEAVTMPSPTKLRYTIRINGKLVQEGRDELSADGRTLTAVSWIVSKRMKERIEVLNRQ